MPFFLRNKLVLDNNHHLMLKDASSGDVRWSNKLDYTQFHTIAQGNSAASRAKFGFQTQGHLVIVTLGHRVFAIDPLNKGRVVWQKNLSMLPKSDTEAPYPMNTNFPWDQRDGSVSILYTDGSAQRLGGQSGALQAGVVCIQTRDAMSALDPVTGRVLWTRTDVNSRAHIFGDDEHLYVVGIGENGAAAGTRVFRAYDGVSVKAQDFGNLYEKRIRLMGRHLLAADVNIKGVITLKIYDILEGKSLFEKEFPLGSVLMQSEDPRLAGVVEPEGVVRVFDVVTQKEVLNQKLDAGGEAATHVKEAKNAKSIHLLADPEYLFVAVNKPSDNNVVGPGEVAPNFRPGQCMRSVPVNGHVYCFDRETGKRRYLVEAPNQQLIVTQFEELPVLFFSSRYTQVDPKNRNPIQVTKGFAVGKHNGKRWWQPKKNKDASDDLESGLYFHSVTMDHRTGKVELIGDSKKIHLTATPVTK